MRRAAGGSSRVVPGSTAHCRWCARRHVEAVTLNTIDPDISLTAHPPLSGEGHTSNPPGPGHITRDISLIMLELCHSFIIGNNTDIYSPRAHMCVFVCVRVCVMCVCVSVCMHVWCVCVCVCVCVCACVRACVRVITDLLAQKQSLLTQKCSHPSRTTRHNTNINIDITLTVGEPLVWHFLFKGQLLRGIITASAICSSLFFGEYSPSGAAYMFGLWQTCAAQHSHVHSQSPKVRECTQGANKAADSENWPVWISLLWE